MPSITSISKETQDNLDSVGWECLYTADTHHSADYGDVSSGYPPPSSYSKFNTNEIQGHRESGLVRR